MRNRKGKIGKGKNKKQAGILKGGGKCMKTKNIGKTGKTRRKDKQKGQKERKAERLKERKIRKIKSKEIQGTLKEQIGRGSDRNEMQES